MERSAEAEGEPPSFRGAVAQLASRHALAAALTVRGIGLVALCAFVSLHVQVVGLFGAGGLLPMADRVDAVLAQAAHPMLEAPSLLLLVGGSDVAMHAVCFLGELASLATMLGVGGALAPLVAYATYLSFVSLGPPFLPLQWDTLLTESLVVAALLAPATLRPVALDRAPPPVPLALFGAWLLVGRLMFAAGYVKLASGDDAWSGLTALDYHFETQPLPNGLAYAMHFAPHGLHAAGVVFTFLVELVLPFAIFFGALGRRIAAGGFLALMTFIALTGNYGFFDALAAVLSLALVDDALLARVLARLRRGFALATTSAPSVTVRRTISALASAQAFLGLLALLSTIGARPAFPDALVALDVAADPFRVANGYGLFAVMTRDRPIVIFEGSDDGETWLGYDYRWQSGDPARGPAVCMPHMPRLDWMVWFAGLSDRPEPWTLALERALLEARPDVLGLFGHDPFDGRAPRYVRTVRYLYSFAPPGDEDWWLRTDRAPYGPTLQGR
ncbi:MAG: lipase maturation factor family protein [Sandaracinus sp.]